MSDTANWLLVAAFLGIIFVPGLIDMVVTMRRQRVRGAGRRQAAARYGRHGYESRYALTEQLPACRPETAPITLPVNRFRRQG